MNDLERYQQLKTKADKLQRQKDQALGAKKQQLAELEREHGVASLKDGEKLLDKLTKEEAKLSEGFSEMLDAAEGKWGGKLEGRE